MAQRAVKIVIPDGLDFAALRLTRDPDGAVSFDTAVIHRICEASGLSADDILAQSEDVVGGLIVAWYGEHRSRGGAPDATAEDLIAEALIEGERGSHKPGRA